MSDENRNLTQKDLKEQDSHGSLAPDVEAEKEQIERRQSDAIARLAASTELKADKPIRKTNRGHIFLIALIVCAIGVGIFFLAQALIPEQEEEARIDETRPVTLSSRLKTDVSRVELTYGGKTTAYVMDDQNYITLEGSADYPLDQTTVGSVFYAFAALTTQDTVADDSVRKADFGFEPPQAAAVVTYDDGEVATYYLGAKSPANNTWYLMMEGREEIFLVWTNVGNYMISDAASMRAKAELAQLDYSSITSLVIANSSGRIELMPQPSDEPLIGISTWRMRAPYTVDADADALSTFLGNFDALSLKGYVGAANNNLAQYGLSQADNPAYVSIEDENGEKVEYYIGSASSSSDYYAWLPAFPEDVYIISSSFCTPVLNAKPISFSTIFAGLVSIDKVDAFELEIGGKTYAVTATRQEQYNEDGSLKTLANGAPNYLEIFTVNGVQQDTDTFKKAYQAIIGVTIDGAVTLDAGGVPESVASNQIDCRVVYHFNNGAPDYEVVYSPYKSLYYAVKTSVTGDYYFYTTREKLAAIDTALATLK